MELVKLKNTDSKEFKQAWKICESSFPVDERRTLSSQKKLLQNKKYAFQTVCKEGVLIAIIASWDFGDFIFIEHLAIEESFRRKGIGTDLLKEYLSNCKQQIVLEVEKPNTEIAKKRIKFYEKLGFKLNNFDYIQPPYGADKKPVPLFLMTYPKKLTELEFFSIRERLHLGAYGLEQTLDK